MSQHGLTAKFHRSWLLVESIVGKFVRFQHRGSTDEPHPFTRRISKTVPWLNDCLDSIAWGLTANFKIGLVVIQLLMPKGYERQGEIIVIIVKVIGT